MHAKSSISIYMFHCRQARATSACPTTSTSVLVSAAANHGWSPFSGHVLMTPCIRTILEQELQPVTLNQRIRQNNNRSAPFALCFIRDFWTTGYTFGKIKHTDAHIYFTLKGLGSCVSRASKVWVFRLSFGQCLWGGCQVEEWWADPCSRYVGLGWCKYSLP